MTYLSTLVFALPPGGLKNWLLRRLGHSVARFATVGPIFVWKCGRFKIGQGSRVAGLSAYIRLKNITIGENASIGHTNWVAAGRDFVDLSKDAGRFCLGEEAAITSRHYIDCSGGVTIGSYSTIGGLGTTILTHGIDFNTNVQRPTSVSVGEYSFVGTGCTLLAGAHLPSRSLLAAGAVLLQADSETTGLYAGVPARWKRALTGDYFTRRRGKVTPSGS